MAMSLTNNRVVILGGATGIGFAVAQLASELGAVVILGSTNAERIASATARLSGATGYDVDLREEASVTRFFTHVGAFDHLVVTAGDWGVPMFVPARDLDLLQAREAFTVRFWGALSAAKHASRSIAEKGSITLTSGLLAQRPAKGAPLATALGGAVEHLAKGLAMDLAPIRVNAVSPGLILTEQVQQRFGGAIDAMVASNPVPRAATPEEAAKAYLYLMLNEYATGQILFVDGGGLLV